MRVCQQLGAAAAVFAVDILNSRRSCENDLSTILIDALIYILSAWNSAKQ